MSGAVPARLDRAGLLLVVLSAAAFGANAIFAKLAYADHATIGELLSFRFGIAAVVFWALLRPRPSRAELRAGLAMGVAYCGQAGFFFTAVSLQDASVTSVFVTITPAVVAVVAVLTGREPARPLVFAGIAGLAVGVALVGLGGGPGGGKVSGAGVALSIGAAVWYAGYLLAGDRVVRRVEPLVLACLICTGGAIGFTAGSLPLGQFRLDLAPRAWVWITLSALVSTVVAITAIMAGMKRVGPSLTGMLTSTETVFTTGYAFLVFGERFSGPQLVGALLVVAAVTAVQLGEHRATPPMAT
jgi:drug/metabolite transporter (DMT)-like permease